MIWGHDPPRTHEKITGKTDSFRASFVFSMTQQHIPLFPVRPERGKMDKIHNMKMTLGERIREQRCRMNLTQEELAEALCIKKSTISMYENDKVDIKTSVLSDLSRELNTSVAYLLGQEDFDEDLLELISIYRSIKDPKIRQVGVAQFKVLSSIQN